MTKINLVKGQKIDLTKGNSSLTELQVGMGWSKKGGGSIDLDASAIALKSGNVLKETVSYQKLKNSDGSIIHRGDDLVGGGQVGAPNEIIDILLNKVSNDTDKIVFILNTFSGGVNFDVLKDSWVAISNKKTGEEIARFTISDNKEFSGKTSLIIGEVYRHNGEWKFNSLGEGTNDRSIRDLEKRVSTGSSASSSASNCDGLGSRIRNFFS